MEEQPVILHWFECDHLPAHLRSTSEPFRELANRIVETLEVGPEREMSLRKLLEAKDAAVRATVSPGF